MTVIFIQAFLAWAFVYLGVSSGTREMNGMRLDFELYLENDIMELSVTPFLTSHHSVIYCDLRDLLHIQKDLYIQICVFVCL